MKCINCENFRFKTSELDKNDMPILGYGHCRLNKESWKYVSFSYDRDCCNFAAITEIEIQARRDEYRDIKYPKIRETEKEEE